jgi:peroxiredoxin
MLSPVVARPPGREAVLGLAEPGRLQMLLFERGHWCSSCRRRLALVSESMDAFAERGVDVLAVTHEAEDAVRGRIYPFPLVADPDMDLAGQFDLIGTDEFDVRTIRPSTIIVRDTGEIAFSYVGDDSRDRPTVPALLLALDNLV